MWHKNNLEAIFLFAFALEKLHVQKLSSWSFPRIRWKYEIAVPFRKMVSFKVIGYLAFLSTRIERDPLSNGIVPEGTEKETRLHHKCFCDEFKQRSLATDYR